MYDRSTTPVRGQSGVQVIDNGQVAINSTENREEAGRGGFVNTWFGREREAPIANVVPENNTDQAKKLTPLETRAMAWDEAERARYLARYMLETLSILIVKTNLSYLFLLLFSVLLESISETQVPMHAFS